VEDKIIIYVLLINPLRMWQMTNESCRDEEVKSRLNSGELAAIEFRIFSFPVSSLKK
jgi:hypothetical protein